MLVSEESLKYFRSNPRKLINKQVRIVGENQFHAVASVTADGKKIIRATGVNHRGFTTFSTCSITSIAEVKDK